MDGEYWKHIEDEAKYVRGHHEKSLIEWTNRTVDKYFSDDYEVRQPLDKPIGDYYSITAHSIFKKENECMAVIESGKFYHEKNENYYVLHYDPEKGENWSIR
jgi:hypothetical protein